MLTLDGSYGEGGGQIVRSALSLSLLTGQAFTITNVRGRRAKPGLRQQHLTAVRAAAEISSATVKGAAVGSSYLSFEPRPVRFGDYRFRIGTAGSTTLVFQTLLPAFLQCAGPTTLRLEGGTHNPFAPPYDFLAQTFLPLVNRLGPSVETRLDRHGFYPVGNGQFTARIQPSAELRSLDLLDRGEIVRKRVRALVANLPTHIAERECRTIAELSGWERDRFQVEQVERAPGPGNLVLIEIQSEHVTEVFTAFGRRGVRAERVAEEAWTVAAAYLASGVPVGPHLADQLLLPFAIAAAQGHPSSFRTGPLTEHSQTHLAVIGEFLGVETRIEGDADNSGAQTVRLASFEK